jgi:hypothetical protein
MTQDTIVIGAGIAGLVTVYELLDFGSPVILIDKNPERCAGGLAAESFGGINITGSPEQKRMGLNDSPALAFADWCSFAEFSEADHYAKEWAQFYTRASKPLVYDWLKKRGVRFFPVVHWVERGKTPRGNRVPRFHMVWGTGFQLIQKILGAIERHPNRKYLKTYFQRTVTAIKRDGQYTVTTLSELDGREETLKAKHLVVASGGYASNLAKVRELWDPSLSAPAPQVLLNGAHTKTDGALHGELSRLGVSMTHLERQWMYAAGVHHPRPRQENHGLSLVPPHSALWLDASGKRIGPVPLITSYDTRWLVESVLKTGFGYSWQILNYKIALKELAVSGAEYNDAIRDRKIFGFLKSILFGNKALVKDLMDHCQDVVVAATLEDLTAKMRALTGDGLLDETALRETVHSYDQAVRDRGSDGQLSDIRELRSYVGDRSRTCHNQTITDPNAGPFIAIRQFILTRKCLGGARTNLSSECVDGRGDVLPGLYAVGETAGFGGGGIHGRRSLEGTFLGTSILTARSAAYHIAKGQSLAATLHPSPLNLSNQ